MKQDGVVCLIGKLAFALFSPLIGLVVFGAVIGVIIAAAIWTVRLLT